ncbi:transmembrane protein 107 isoform X1 [Trichosurus vulpecula]|uniref:transmembrane protein 107 isoform X1 n=1 Tax=Trichosurus vulpecula TaxID=9337 RepID=UPI00186B1ADE|nr:transmembrane protein 107 isoform X1 [Trichosurus vulpecula]
MNWRSLKAPCSFHTPRLNGKEGTGQTLAALQLSFLLCPGSNTLCYSCPSLLPFPRTTTSRPVCLPTSPPRSMRRRTLKLAGFFSGVSMFNSTQSLFSIGLHCCAAVSLAFFVFESWECSTYWYIFAFCSVLPAFTEIIMFIAVFVLKKKSF